MPTTKLSSKGQICIPKRIRTAQSWRVGQTFDVIETPDGILLRPHTEFSSTSLDLLGNALNYKGSAHPVEELGLEALPYYDPYAPEHDGA